MALCFFYLASSYHDGIAEGIAILGMGLVSLGLVFPMHIASVQATKGTVVLGKRMLLLIKGCFVRKRG